MNSSEIRSRFLEYFEEQGHRIQESAPLLTSDPDLLFNIAGMVPFKPYFLGDDEPPASRITTAQKCIRTEDIDQVGQTARHLTFFEMLGNFSFGDYFKEDAIQYGWRFLVDEMDLDPDRLWITVFGGDEELEADTEAESIWRNVDGVREERILHLNREENFWAMGATGPCGPCSEILYDQDSKNTDPEDVKQMILDGKDRILELWNLVFMEFERPEQGADLRPLPQKNIDTGLGLERLAAILQDADSNFGTDLFLPIIREIDNRVGDDLDEPADNARYRVIADHLRASSFLLAEGLLPGNEGRGYVLRRLIRRAHLRGRRLGLEGAFLPDLVPTVVDIMGGHFDELTANQEAIQQQLHDEEEQFERILDQGLDELDDRIATLRGQDQNKMAGDEIFDLYETHGLPLEMTRDVLDDENIDYDEDEIERAREEHEERSRDVDQDDSEKEFEGITNVPGTEFTGYEKLQHEAEIVALYKGADHEPVRSVGVEPRKTINVLFDRTPFYAEGGGQKGDRGWIEHSLKIANTTEHSKRHVHRIDPPENYDGPETLEVGQTVHVEVDENFRRGNMRHHTATHLLHHALRKELGDQVMQDGSSLDDESLRFDFTYNEAVDRKTLDSIERTINEWIDRDIPVRTEVMSRDEAEERGALAFFGEHYGQEVRVVEIVDEDPENLDSKEFCGGTHLDSTGTIGVFTITNETAVASGVRRIEAKAGKPAYDELKRRSDLLRKTAGEVGLQQEEQIPKRVSKLQDQLDEKEEELERLRQKESSQRADELADDPETVGGVAVVVEVVEDPEDDVLKNMVDEVHQRLEPGVVLLVGRSQNNVQLVLGTNGEATESLDAGDWVRELGSIVGGGGGGRPDFAEAGGSKPEAVPEAIDHFNEMVNEELGETARN